MAVPPCSRVKARSPPWATARVTPALLISRSPTLLARPMLPPARRLKLALLAPRLIRAFSWVGVPSRIEPPACRLMDPPWLPNPLRLIEPLVTTARSPCSSKLPLA